MNFNEKIILITGAGSGIGAETAKHLAKLGGKFALVDINGENLQEVIEDIVANGSQFTPLKLVADVTTDAQQILSKTIDHFGKLDVLINNVGIVARHGLVDLQMDMFDRIMQTNVRSTVILTQLAVPHLKLTKGNVVNVSSLVGSIAHPGLLSYSMSKAAINQFTKCIAVELGPLGIRVNAIAPGIIHTNMVEALPLAEKESLMKNVQQAYPLGRLGQANDISSAIAFLANNDAAAFVTGTIMSVDGGASAANIV